jgi:hypothetical protein
MARALPFIICFDLEKLFHHAVLKMLKTEGKITDAVIENMLSWRHIGFNVYCGPAIWPHGMRMGFEG